MRVERRGRVTLACSAVNHVVGRAGEHAKAICDFQDGSLGGLQDAVTATAGHFNPSLAHIERSRSWSGPGCKRGACFTGPGAASL